MTYERRAEAPKMMTIRETATASGVPVNAVRGLVKSGKIVYINAGTKVLINFDRFLEFLNKGEGGA